MNSVEELEDYYKTWDDKTLIENMCLAFSGFREADDHEIGKYFFQTYQNYEEELLNRLKKENNND